MSNEIREKIGLRIAKLRESRGLSQKQLADELEKIGLAAPQVGILRQLVVIDVGDGNQYVLINPEIIEQSGEVTDYEGCLSVPGMRGKVKRAEKVTVKALNEEFEPIAIAAEGLLARCIQHEVDHCNGVLI